MDGVYTQEFMWEEFKKGGKGKPVFSGRGPNAK